MKFVWNHTIFYSIKKQYQIDWYLKILQIVEHIY